MRILFYMVMWLYTSSVFAQRNIHVSFKQKKGTQSYLIVKYKGKKGDYFDPVTLDYFLPNPIKDSIRLMNYSDFNMSGVLFFLSREGDSILYQVWDTNLINTDYFQQYNNRMFDYEKWNGFRKKRNKMIIPISINPNIINICNMAIYRVLIRKGMVGEEILWVEDKVVLSR